MDTNVLVYASRSTARVHRQATDGLARAEDGGNELYISRQVLREYPVTVTRPQADATPLPPEAAVDDLRRFAETYTVLEDGPAVTEELLRSMTRFPTGGERVHDANLVATMLAHGVRRLLTFNEADFHRFGVLVALEPT